jgi:hypothetical protein
MMQFCGINYLIMQAIQNTYNSVILPVERSQSIVKTFLNWCESQEKYRFGWLAAIIVIHGCLLAPLTLFAIFIGGNNFVFWAMTIGAFAMALVSNLAAMPTKITIPVFFFSILIDLVVITASLVYAFQS